MTTTEFVMFVMFLLADIVALALIYTSFKTEDRLAEAVDVIQELSAENESLRNEIRKMEIMNLVKSYGKEEK